MSDATYLTMQEAGELMRFEPKYARISAQRFLKQHGIPLSRRGRTYLVRRSLLEAYLDTGDTHVRLRKVVG